MKHREGEGQQVQRILFDIPRNLLDLIIHGQPLKNFMPSDEMPALQPSWVPEEAAAPLSSVAPLTPQPRWLPSSSPSYTNGLLPS